MHVENFLSSGIHRSVGVFLPCSDVGGFFGEYARGVTRGVAMARFSIAMISLGGKQILCRNLAPLRQVYRRLQKLKQYNLKTCRVKHPPKSRELEAKNSLDFGGWFILQLFGLT